MKRSELLAASAALGLTACSKTVGGLLTPVASGLNEAQGGLIEANACSSEYDPKWNYMTVTCSGGVKGRAQIPFFPKQQYFANWLTMDFYSPGTKPRTLTLQLGDKKWGEKKMFHLWEKYFYIPNGENGGSLRLQNGTPIMDAVFDPHVQKNVTLTLYKNGQEERQVQHPIHRHRKGDNIEPDGNGWGCAASSLGLVGSFLVLASTEWTVVGAIGGACLVIGSACGVRAECF
jgi:hypothetical protein